MIHGAVERAGALELAHGQVDALVLPSAALSSPTYARIGVARAGSPMISVTTSAGVTVQTKRRPGARQRREGHEALVAPAHELVRRCDVERGLDRLLARLDAMECLLGEGASGRAERGERHGVGQRTPYRLVAGQKARQRAGEHVGEPSLGRG